MANTKARSLEIYTAAASALGAVGGVVKVDQTPEGERWTLLRQMAEKVVTETGCTMESARRNVAKAMRRARYGVMQERWGGARPGAAQEKGDRLMASHNIQERRVIVEIEGLTDCIYVCYN